MNNQLLSVILSGVLMSVCSVGFSFGGALGLSSSSVSIDSSLDSSSVTFSSEESSSVSSSSDESPSLQAMIVYDILSSDVVEGYPSYSEVRSDDLQVCNSSDSYLSDNIISMMDGNINMELDSGSCAYLGGVGQDFVDLAGAVVNGVSIEDDFICGNFTVGKTYLITDHQDGSVSCAHVE